MRRLPSPSQWLSYSSSPAHYSEYLLILSRLSAVAVLVNYWIPPTKVNNAVWISIAYVVVVSLNLTTSGVYGETEFLFSSIKVLTILGLISKLPCLRAFS
jgi:amino acid transporter